MRASEEELDALERKVVWVLVALILAGLGALALLQGLPPKKTCVDQGAVVCRHFLQKATR